MATQTLKAQPRKVLGRKVKKLRRDGVLPANIYGKKIKSQAVQVDVSKFDQVFKKAGETGLVDLVLDRKKKPVLIHNVQFNPVTDEPIHADFLQVDLKEKVTAQVPVELNNESPAEKEGKGTVVQYIDEIEVEALPKDLPEKFGVDLSRLKEVNDTFSVKDVEVDVKKVKINNEPEQVVVKVEPPRKVEEVVAPAEEEVPEEEAEEEAVEVQEEEKGKGEPKPQAKRQKDDSEARKS